MDVHDECIDDLFYATGWGEISTCSLCVNGKCKCMGSGACKSSIFNYYMYRVEDPPSASELDQFDFPLSINVSTVDELAVEEVRCRPYTVGVAYDYYTRSVIRNSLTETMVSVFLGDYKSTCFNMSCYVLEMENSVIREGYVTLRDLGEGHSLVLAKDLRVTNPLLEAICMLDVNPIVSPTGNFDLKVVSKTGSAYRIKAGVSGFRLPENGSLNLMELPEASCKYQTHGGDTSGVRAVGTAYVTASLVLTPKSMYGGKNPTSKLVSYFVHNVSL